MHTRTQTHAYIHIHITTSTVNNTDSTWLCLCFVVRLTARKAFTIEMKACMETGSTWERVLSDLPRRPMIPSMPNVLPSSGWKSFVVLDVRGCVWVCLCSVSPWGPLPCPQGRELCVCGMLLWTAVILQRYGNHQPSSSSSSSSATHAPFPSANRHRLTPLLPANGEAAMFTCSRKAGAAIKHSG